MNAKTASLSDHRHALLLWKKRNPAEALRAGLPPASQSILRLSLEEIEAACARAGITLASLHSASPSPAAPAIDPDMIRRMIREQVATETEAIRREAAEAKAESEKAVAEAKAESKKAQTMLSALKGDAATSARIPLVVAAVSGNPVADALMSHYAPGKACPFPLCIFSPPSFGKSHGIAALGRSYDKCVTHGCCNNPDEWEVLVGGAVAAGSEGFILSDGKLTEAMRAASKGQNVLLVLDEVLRWPEKVQELLLTFLQPATDAKGVKVFRLTTRHRDKKTQGFEVLEAKVENLHIVAAANLTHRTPVEAFWSRFEKKRFNFSQEIAASIAKSIAGSYGIAGAEKLANNFATLMAATRTSVVNRVLAFPADFRLLERACAYSDGTAASAAQYVASKLIDNCASWDSDTGDTVAESGEAARVLAESFLRLDFAA